MMVWFRQVASMTFKEFPQLVRDRPVFIYIVFIFTLNIILAAGKTVELNNAKLIINDADQSSVSRELSYRFRAPYFRVAETNLHPDTAMEWLDRGLATRRGEQQSQILRIL